MRRPRSRHEPPNVDRRRLVLRFALVLAADREPGHAVEAVAGILAGAADQEVFLLVHHVAAVVLAHLEVGRELNRIRRARLFAEPAVDAAREVDAEPCRIPAAGLVLGLLERDAVDRTRDRAEVTRDAALLSVRVARQDDAAAEAGREIGLLLGVEDRLALAEAVHEDADHALHLAAEHGELSVEPALGHRHHVTPSPFIATTMAPVTSAFSSASGSRNFHAYPISWP